MTGHALSTIRAVAFAVLLVAVGYMFLTLVVHNIGDAARGAFIGIPAFIVWLAAAVWQEARRQDQIIAAVLGQDES
jgi:hypothetical protein